MAQFPSTDGESDPTRTRLYNPYQDLNLPIQSMYRVPTSPEYLFSEEAQRQRRSWGENLTFYTGTAYLAGATSGAAYGLAGAFRSFEPSDTAKLKVNRVLNSSGQAGRTWGNRIGIVGLVYAGLESGIVAVTNRDDVWTSVVAGLGTGAVCRAARGVRSAAVAGALGGLAAGAAVAGRQAMKRYAMI